MRSGRERTTSFQPVKILVVGYACNPHGGSEPGVGWTAVCRIAKKHEVCVLTDIHNKAGWDAAREQGGIPNNIRVRFLRERSACSSNRFIAHVQSWLNYSAFNCMVLQAAEAWHREEHFDLCHQVTIAAWRMPSPLWQLPIPFVWGPIGGAGHIPSTFRSMLSTQARLFESARDINTYISSRSKAFRLCIQNTAVVFAANEETELFLKPFRGGRPLIRLPIASLPAEKVEKFRRPPKTWLELPSSSAWPGHPVPASVIAGHPQDSGWKPELQNSPEGSIPETRPQPLRLFAGGNMEGRKGVSLALKTLSRVDAKGVDFHYTIAGGGPEIPSLKNLAHDLGLSDKVEFHSGYSGDDYIRALQETEVYFLPSFRESTPVTLLEAILAGCYPVVADTSAQGEIVRLVGGHAVPANDMNSLILGLAEALIWCAGHRADLPALTEAAGKRVAAEFSSERYQENLDKAYRTASEKTSGDV